MRPLDNDPHDLARFVTAQDFCYARVLDELRAGQKQTHWMWFIFPQLRGLGSSPRAWTYGVTGLDEATAYLAHPVLGPRLTECTDLAIAAAPRTALQIFGRPDDLKLQASMTLFDAVVKEARFSEALTTFFGGARHDATLERLAHAPP